MFYAYLLLIGQNHLPFDESSERERARVEAPK